MSKRRKWTDEETQYLVENYQNLSGKQIADYLSMDVSQVRSKAFKSKLTRKSLRSKETDEFILKNHDSMSIVDLIKETGLKRDHINKIKRELGVSKEYVTKPWSAEEDEFILNNHESMNYREISEVLGRGRKSVKNRYVYLNLGPKNRVKSKEYRYWTPEEEKYLSDNFYKMSTEKLAKNIDRTEEAIYSKAYLLGLCADQDE